MPRLPTADQLGPAPMPPIRGNIPNLQLETPNLGHEAAALADFGNAMQGVGGSLAVMAQKEKRDLDATRTEAATTDYMNGLSELQLGKGGYNSILGGDAVNQPLLETYRTKRAELNKQISDGLTNPEQQQAFARRSAIADRQFDSHLYQHIAQQSRVYQGQVYEGAQATERRQAALNWDQPGQIELSLLRINKNIDQKALAEGLHPEREGDRQVIDTLKTIAETQVHSDVIDQMLVQGKDAAAAAYYDQMKANRRLTPEAVVTIGAKVGAASVDGEAMRGADQVWGIMGPRTPNDPIRLDVMGQWLRDKYQDKPRIANAAITEIRSRAAATNDAQRELTDSNKSIVLNAYHDGADLKTLQTMPEYLALEGQDRSSIRDYVTNSGWNDQQRARAERDHLEGDKAHAGFQRFWDLSNPSVLSAMSENSVKALEPELGQTLTGNLMSLRRQLNTPAKIQTASIDNDLFNTLAANVVGLTPFANKPSAVQKEKLGRLRNGVETVIGEAQQRAGRELSRDEKQTLMQSEINRQVQMPTWFGLSNQSLPAATVTPQQRPQTYVPISTIDPQWLKGAINYMRSTGAVPMEWSDDKAKINMKKQLEHAYAISITGGTADEGKKALGGQ